MWLKDKEYGTRRAAACSGEIKTSVWFGALLPEAHVL